MVSQEEVRELFEYREDGHLYWKISKGKAKKGDRYGCVTTDGAVFGRINNKGWLEHRLIWLYHFGYLPPLIDHKDRNRSNNKIENLRQATQAENLRNSKVNKNNTTGHKNVYYRKDSNTWFAKLYFNGKPVRSKPLKTKEEAITAAVQMREQRHGEFVSHG